MQTATIRHIETGAEAEFKGATEEQWYLFVASGMTFAAKRNLAAQCKVSPTEPADWLALIREWPGAINEAYNALCLLGGLPIISDEASDLDGESDGYENTMRLTPVRLRDTELHDLLAACGVGDELMAATAKHPPTKRGIFCQPGELRAYILAPPSSDAIVKRDQYLTAGRHRDAYMAIISSALLFPTVDVIADRASSGEYCLPMFLAAEANRLIGLRAGTIIIKKGSPS